MDASAVVALYRALEAAGIPVWIDGGWCVEALIRRPLRAHDDLDIAVHREHGASLSEWFRANAWRVNAEPEPTEWSYVVSDPHGITLDVHLVEYDDAGEPRWGIAYPAGSLTGTGELAGTPVRCIAPEWMYRFKTAYPPAEKDLIDVRALAQAYRFELPDAYR
jgi:lincosamide nucleotidyltransferase A/C/D/E